MEQKERMETGITSSIFVVKSIKVLAPLINPFARLVVSLIPPSALISHLFYYVLWWHIDAPHGCGDARDVTLEPMGMLLLSPSSSYLPALIFLVLLCSSLFLSINSFIIEGNLGVKLKYKSGEPCYIMVWENGEESRGEERKGEERMKEIEREREEGTRADVRMNDRRWT